MPLTTDFSSPCAMISSSSTTIVPGRSLPSAASNEDSTCTRTWWFIASSTERVCSTLEPCEAISSISS